jgi:hypothetical protein
MLSAILGPAPEGLSGEPQKEKRSLRGNVSLLRMQPGLFGSRFSFTQRAVTPAIPEALSFQAISRLRNIWSEFRSESLPIVCFRSSVVPISPGPH